MKILSMNFVKEADIPDRTRNTEMAKWVQEIGEKVKSAPAGQGLAVKVDKAEKWHRYSLQRRLQKLGHKVTVTLHDGALLIKRVQPQSAKK